MQLVFIKNFFKLGLFKYSEDFLLFIGSIIISRLVGPSEYGVVVIVTIFYGFLDRFTDVGLTAFIIREKESEELLVTVQFFFIALSVSLGVVLLLLAFPLSLFYSAEVLAPCIAYVGIMLVDALPKASAAALLKKQNFNLIAKTGLISTIFMLILSVALAFLGFSYWVLIIPQFFPPLISLYFYRKELIVPFKVPTRSQMKEALERCKPLIKNLSLFTVLNYWARNTDNFFIGKLYGEGRLGLYNRAYSFSNLPVRMIGNVFSKIQLPIFQKKVDDVGYIRQQYKQLLNLLTTVIAVPFVFLYLFAGDVVLILWGKTWLDVAVYLPLLSILMLVYIINITVNDMLILFRKDKYISISSMIAGLSTIIGLSIGVFISIKVMIYIYVLNVLLTNSITVIYIVFYRVMKFKAREIAEIWLCNWLTAFSLILLNIFDLRKYHFIPLAIFVAVSTYKFIVYVKQVRGEAQEQEGV
jgi:teichuronic acid exporter